MWNDIQYAARLLRRSPLFTFTAVLSLAIGIAGNAAILVRTTGPNVLPAMRETIQQMDGSLPILRVGMLSELTAFGLLPQRLTAWLAAAVGLITVLLATIGIYGITAHGIAQRRRQIGIRVALGAQRWQVLGMVVRHAISLTGAGAIVGLQRAASLDPVQALRSE